MFYFCIFYLFFFNIDNLIFNFIHQILLLVLLNFYFLFLICFFNNAFVLFGIHIDLIVLWTWTIKFGGNLLNFWLLNFRRFTNFFHDLLRRLYTVYLSDFERVVLKLDVSIRRNLNIKRNRRYWTRVLLQWNFVHIDAHYVIIVTLFILLNWFQFVIYFDVADFWFHVERAAQDRVAFVLVLGLYDKDIIILSF